MIITIYNYLNEPLEIEITKPIDFISVEILSGDETIKVFYEDGSSDFFDSAEDREINFFDGSYVVDTHRIDLWNSFVCEKNCSICSYCRQEWFEEVTSYAIN